MSRVLLVAHLFPPVGGIGVQRSLKFAQYLGEYGIHPVVLTANHHHTSTLDEKLLEAIPSDVPVFRVDDDMARLMSRISPVQVAPAAPRSAIEAGGSAAPSGSPRSQVREQKARVSFIKRGLVRRLKQVRGLVAIPDEALLWALRAAWQARILVQEEKIDCVLTTSGPNSAHIVGLLVKRWTGVPWVADFRDPWTDNMHFSARALRAAVERRLERRVLREADAVVTVTDSFAELFRRKEASVRGKVSVIRNGVDPLDFPPHDTLPRSGPLTLLYAGILYPKRSPKTFLQALRRALDAGRIAEDGLQVEFAGVFDSPGSAENAELVERLDLQRIVRRLGYLSHAEVAKRMMQAHALLLIGDDDERAGMYIPGKLYEYLYARRPILALLKEGEASRWILRCNAGVVASNQSVADVEDALVELVQRIQQEGCCLPDHPLLQSLTRQAQAADLARLLNEVTAVQTGQRISADSLAELAAGSEEESRR